MEHHFEPKRAVPIYGPGHHMAMVLGAIHKGSPTNDLIAVKYLETLGNMAEGSATKTLLPYEAAGINEQLRPAITFRVPLHPMMRSTLPRITIVWPI